MLRNKNFLGIICGSAIRTKLILKLVKGRKNKRKQHFAFNYLIPLSLYPIFYIFFQIMFYWSLVHTEHVMRNP